MFFCDDFYFYNDEKTMDGLVEFTLIIVLCDRMYLTEYY